MNRGKLTPRSNERVAGMRFTGTFDQPDGFGSVLTAIINRSGDLSLTLQFKTGASSDHESFWTVQLDNEQRKQLAEFAKQYEPTLTEVISEHDSAFI